jgi:uncharacterized surface protein with fasciclin (FAS1) repeats
LKTPWTRKRKHGEWPFALKRIHQSSRFDGGHQRGVIFRVHGAAFAKLPAGTVENLVKPENKATLTSILTYHVVAGNYP